jgi:hypothetical protein
VIISGAVMSKTGLPQGFGKEKFGAIHPSNTAMLCRTSARWVGGE